MHGRVMHAEDESCMDGSWTPSTVQLEATGHGPRRRRRQEREPEDVVDPERLELQQNARQVAALHLRDARAPQLEELGLGVEPVPEDNKMAVKTSNQHNIGQF